MKQRRYYVSQSEYDLLFTIRDKGISTDNVKSIITVIGLYSNSNWSQEEFINILLSLYSDNINK